MTKKICQATSVAIVLYFFAHFLMPFRVYPYADDWAYTQPIMFKSAAEWLNWLMMQHVDHRIPIQKLFSYIVLRVSGYDMRVLIAFDCLLALSMTYSMLYIARIFRGSQSIGDLLIPLVTLEYAAGYTQWAFQFTFLFSMVATTWFVAACVQHKESGSSRSLIFACLATLACSLDGLNGLISATWCAGGLAGWLVLRRPSIRPSVYAILGACLAVDAIIWLSWTPSNASDVHADPSEVLRFMAGLIPGSMLMYALHDTWWKTLFVSALAASAAVALVLDVVRRRIEIDGFSIMLGAIASLLIILSVSIGRSKIQGGWSDIIGIHYGYLAILIPVMSWIYVSRPLPVLVREIIGAVLVLIFARSFEINMDWRQYLIDTVPEHQFQVMQDLRASADAATVVDAYALDFTWSEDAGAKREVVKGIEALRSIGASLYARNRDDLYGTLDAGQSVTSLPVGGECWIDSIGEKSVGDDATRVSAKAVTIQGWAKLSVGISAPDAKVRLALTGDDGQTWYSEASRTERPDVDAALNLTPPAHMGYTARVDLRTLHGAYSVRVVQDGPDGAVACATRIAHLVHD